jgi:hypothetical protein
MLDDGAVGIDTHHPSAGHLDEQEPSVWKPAQP